jgi:hypothetical protein
MLALGRVRWFGNIENLMTNQKKGEIYVFTKNCNWRCGCTNDSRWRREFDGGRDGFVTEFHGGGSDQ